MASLEQTPSSTHYNPHRKLPVKRSLSGKCVRPTAQHAAGPLSSQPSPSQLSFPPRNSSQPSAIETACFNEQHQHFLRKYRAEDIIRGHELAKQKHLFGLLRDLLNHNAADVHAGLRFAEDGALDFFDAFKNFRGSDVLDARTAIIGNLDGTTNAADITGTADVNPDTWRDSGYQSRPASKLRYSAGSITLPNIPLENSQLLVDHPSAQNSHQHDPFSVNKVANPDSSTALFAEPRRLQPFNSPHHLLTPYDPPTGSTSYSPGETSKVSQLREYECTYCPKDFVRARDCLNHEEAHHNQEKKWTCPHCPLQTDTQKGIARHHRKTHNCPSQGCSQKETVEDLSKPKTACACPYCGYLFQGESSFKERSDHVESIHYKGDVLKKRGDLDYTKMILSLLRRKELDGPWKIFIAEKSNRALTWTADKARAIVTDLEKGTFPKGVHALVQEVYGMSTEVSAELDESRKSAVAYQTSSSKMHFPNQPVPRVPRYPVKPLNLNLAKAALPSSYDVQMESPSEDENEYSRHMTANRTSGSSPRLRPDQSASRVPSGYSGIAYQHSATAMAKSPSNLPPRKPDRSRNVTPNRSYIRQNVFMGSDTNSSRNESLSYDNPREDTVNTVASLVTQPVCGPQEYLGERYVTMPDLETNSIPSPSEHGIGLDMSMDSTSQGFPPVTISGAYYNLELQPPSSPSPWSQH